MSKINKNKKGCAGGAATAKILKMQARKRIDEYNKNPNLCKLCNKKIIAPYDKPLKDTVIKIFCSRSCATKYRNIEKKIDYKYESWIASKSDKEIIDAFYSSISIKNFCEKLGYYGNSTRSESFLRKLNELNLDLNEIKVQRCFYEIQSSKKKDIFLTHKSWQSARSIIRRNARMIYDKSNKPKYCIVCGYDKYYEVAHIKSVSSFDDDSLISEINSIDNLIALCPNHHWEYDNTDFDITPFL